MVTPALMLLFLSPPAFQVHTHIPREAAFLMLSASEVRLSQLVDVRRPYVLLLTRSLRPARVSVISFSSPAQVVLSLPSPLRVSREPPLLGKKQSNFYLPKILTYLFFLCKPIIFDRMHVQKKSVTTILSLFANRRNQRVLPFQEITTWNTSSSLSGIPMLAHG